MREIYCTYKIADALYSQWNLIEEYYSSYQDDGIIGVGKALGKNIASEVVGNVETNIIWNAIHDKIKPEDRDTTKNILSTVIENVTDEEINYVERYLNQNF